MRFAVEIVMFIVACIAVAFFEHADLGIGVSIWHCILLVIIVYLAANVARLVSGRMRR